MKAKLDPVTKAKPTGFEEATHENHTKRNKTSYRDSGRGGGEWERSETRDRCGFMVIRKR